MRLVRASAQKITGGMAAVMLMATAAASLAPAAPVDQQTCDQMKREITMLEGMGVRDNLGKGAAWGKVNLRSQQLEQVKKLIEMDEAVAFRCPRPKPEPVVAAAKGKAVAKTAAAKTAVAKAAANAPAGEDKTAAKDIVKPQVKPRPKPAAPVDGAQTPGAPAQSAAAPKPKPKPAPPKASDAYTQPKAAPVAN